MFMGNRIRQKFIRQIVVPGQNFRGAIVHLRTYKNYYSL